jgi:hypothetical protein
VADRLEEACARAEAHSSSSCMEVEAAWERVWKRSRSWGMESVLEKDPDLRKSESQDRKSCHMS